MLGLPCLMCEALAWYLDFTLDCFVSPTVAAVRSFVGFNISGYQNCNILEMYQHFGVYWGSADLVVSLNILGFSSEKMVLCRPDHWSSILTLVNCIPIDVEYQEKNTILKDFGVFLVLWFSDFLKYPYILVVESLNLRKCSYAREQTIWKWWIFYCHPHVLIPIDGSGGMVDLLGMVDLGKTQRSVSMVFPSLCISPKYLGFG